MAQSASVEQDNAVLHQLVPQEREVRERIPLLTGGMRTDKTPPELQDNEAVNILNLNFVAGVLGTDTGYAPFGSTFLGQPCTTFQVFNPDGTAIDFLVTTATVYQYVQAVTQWQLISFGQAYSISHVGGYPANTTTFVLNSVTNLVAGQTFGIGQSDGTQFVSTIQSVNAGAVSITLNAGCTQTVNNGAPCALAAPLTGDVSGQTQVILVEFPSFGTIISNGVNPIFYYNGSFLLNLPGLPTNTTCKAMVVAHEQLLIANTTENGTDLPQRLRASNQGDPTAWTPGGAGSIAAIYDLIDTEDFILSLNILGPFVVVYRETTIMRGSYLGLPNQTWFWEYMIFGEGIISQGAVAEIGDSHLIVGTASVYLYDASYELTSVGDGVFFDFFSALGILNPKARGAVFCQYVGDFDECWVFFPSGTNMFPNQMLRIDLENTAWFQRTFFDQFVSCQPRLTIQELTWATAPGTWSSHVETWDSRVFLQNVPNLFLCSPTQQQIMVYDYTARQDNGNVINWSLTTKQYGDGQQFTRWERLVLVGQGTNISVSYSEDEGNTFVSLGTVSLASIPTVGSVYIDHVAPQIMFKLTGSDPNFQLRYGRLQGVYESDY